MRWAIIALLSFWLAWSRYDLSLTKEQNLNLTEYVQNLEDEARGCSKKLQDCTKNLRRSDTAQCLPQIIEVPVYEFKECEQCKSYYELCVQDE